MIKTTVVPYSHEETDLEAFVAYPSETKCPLVILCHAWAGRDDFICEKAKLIASWGFVGFAIDMYGKGVLGKSQEENASLKKPFLLDRQRLLKRLSRGLEVASNFPFCDPSRIVSLGFGFGGVCSLDLARNQADLSGAISVYGHFDPPHFTTQKSINAKILIIHGHQDPVAPIADLSNFAKEMDAAHADWQIQIFSHTQHAFMNPAANDPNSGILYNPSSANRTWVSIHSFLKEIYR